MEIEQPVQQAFRRGRADRILCNTGNHFFNAHKVASDLYPTDDQLFEAYMQGWDAGAGLKS